MNAVIDQKVCTGCGLCVKTCPRVFQMENGKAIVMTSSIPDDLEVICSKVVRDCPARAIYIGLDHALMIAAVSSQNRSWIAF